MRSRLLFPAAGVFVLVATLGAQKPFSLTIDNIMRGPGLYGYEPSAPRFAADSGKIWFEWKQASEPVLKPFDTYEVNRDGSGLRKLTEDEAKLIPPTGAERSKDGARLVWAREGDIFIRDNASGRTRRVTRTADVESNAHWTRDGKRIWFTRSGNLYTLSLEDGALEQLTDIRPAGAADQPAAGPGGARGMAAARGSGEPPKGTDSQEFVKKEERDLIDVVSQRAKIREEEEARRKRENPRKAMTLQPRQTVASLILAPDEKTVIAAIGEAPQGTKNTIVPNFVTESGYTEDIGSRNKVGDVQAHSRMAIVGVADGSVKWIEHGQQTPTAGDGKKPAERDVALMRPEFSEDGTKAVLMARSADNKDRWLLALDMATGKTRVLTSDHDEAWIRGLGGFDGFGRGAGFGWMKNGQDLWFLSERTGYSQLYAVPYDGGEPRALTSGRWEIGSAWLSEDKSKFYLVSNEPDPSEVHLFSMPAEGGPRTRITSSKGHHAPALSADERWIADIHSYANKPPELYVMENRPGAEERKLTSSPAPDFASYPWIDAPITHFTTRDGAEAPVRVYKPANFQRGGPAVVFVHGAGYLQNVHKWWSSYSHEYLFHHFLMEHGYLVIDIDYRGSAGYGRDWRTAIYRHMGGKDLDDHVDAARWIVSQYGVNPKKIGIYGGSYGGFITLMALFTQPDVFAAGAALRPVTDWAHYNHGYTSSILNMPQKDAEAYKQSSPIYFAAGLKGALLICHGMADTNVHFQDTVRLAQKLIELRKTNWDIAMYPVEDHGFVQPTSWADEYKRIFALFEKNLK